MRTERDIVIAHTRQWFVTSEWSVERFANEKLFPALRAAGLLEEVDTDDVEAYVKANKAQGERLRRIFSGTLAFPLEWKWVWLHMLPDEHYKRARADLLAMAGCLDVRLPELIAPIGFDSTKAQLGELMARVGDFMAAAQPAHDGVYNESDDPAEVDRMMIEGAEAMAAMMNELLALSAGTGRPLPFLVLAKYGANGK